MESMLASFEVMHPSHDLALLRSSSTFAASACISPYRPHVDLMQGEMQRPGEHPLSMRGLADKYTAAAKSKAPPV